MLLSNKAVLGQIEENKPICFISVSADSESVSGV